MVNPLDEPAGCPVNRGAESGQRVTSSEGRHVMRRVWVQSFQVLAVCSLMAQPFVSTLAAAQTAPAISEADLLARMTPEQARLHGEWRQARAAYDGVSDRYWSTATALKTERRRKRNAGIALSPADFVQQHPAKYTGPALRADIAKLIADLKPPQPETPIAVVADVLAQATQSYAFTPRLTSEREFKRSYAIEALAVGLTKDQVVRVYALETGGRGTYDMQAGFDPETRRGRAISTALGYAQLLAANSIDELVRYGDGFIARLNMLAAAPAASDERRAELVAKAASLRAMLKVARGVPREWADHVRLASTPAGTGIHAINLDADIGPWLQAVKLKGLKDLAEKNGRPVLTGAEIELMNLAGPRTGLDMMEPVAQTASTGNFFSASAYWRNGIVRDKTAAELLVALDARMNDNLGRAGAVEFAAVFDEVAANGASLAPFNYVAAETPARAREIQAPRGPATPALAAREPAPRLQWAPRQFGERTGTDPSKWSPMTVTE